MFTIPLYCNNDLFSNTGHIGGLQVKISSTYIIVDYLNYHIVVWYSVGDYESPVQFMTYGIAWHPVIATLLLLYDN